MAKSKNNTTTGAATPTATESLILTLAVIAALEQPEQIALYVNTEERVRCGFLQQGKILQSLGEGAVEMLRAAGIRPTTLANARNAQWVYHTFTHLPDPVRFHNGTELVPFTEAFYDTLTLRQCDLLRKSFSGMGTVLHRPSIEKARQMTELENWDDNLECFHQHGTDLAGIAAREAQAAAELRAEQERVANLERQIVEMETQQAAADATPAAPPAIAFNVPAPRAVAALAEEEDEADQEIEHEGAADEHHDMAEATDEEEADESQDQEQEPADEGETEGVDTASPVEAIVEEIDDSTFTAETPDEAPAAESPLTPEEVGAAVSDATAGIFTLAMWNQAFETFKNTTEAFLTQADREDAVQVALTMADLLESVKNGISAAAAPAAKRGRGKGKSQTEAAIAA